VRVRPAAANKSSGGGSVKGVEKIIMLVAAIAGIVILLLLGIYLAQTGQGLAAGPLDFLKNLASALTGKP